jgi:hypothetical protein
MEYYKGNCMAVMQLDYDQLSRIRQRYTELQPTSNRRTYQFDRQEHQAKQEMNIWLDGTLLVTISHKPDKATLHGSGWAVKELARFFKNYLAGVQLTIKKEGE